MPRINFICPYCFERRKISEVQFRCTNRRCKDFDDVEITRYENGNLNLPKQGKRTFTPAGRLKTSADCPECGNKTYKRICPACHNELPDSTLDGEDMIISIVGGRASGKSHFVGVLIEELIKRIAPAFGGAMEGFADSYTRWQTGFYKHLYMDGVKLELTRSSLQGPDNGAYRPLIFKLKLPEKKLFGSGIKSFTFVFFDTAGEDLNDEDTMSTVNKYICKSAGIIFLLDPVQIGAVANQLDQAVAQRAAAIDWRAASQSDDIMTRVSRLIRNDRGLKDGDKIDTPVAAVFSKFDVIEPLVPAGCVIRDVSPHCSLGRFDLTDSHNVNGEVQGLLDAWDASAFTSQLSANYNTYSYFAVSALGLNNNPTADGRISRPRPHRIEDPVLWLLKENKVIPAK